MRGLEKVSHKNVIDSTISLFFLAISLLVSLFFVTFLYKTKMISPAQGN